MFFFYFIYSYKKSNEECNDKTFKHCIIKILFKFEQTFGHLHSYNSFSSLNYSERNSIHNIYPVKDIIYQIPELLSIFI